jgi:glyoxylase-like metal-dependent hydrolase (beta-lactamase superfamily II)
MAGSEVIRHTTQSGIRIYGIPVEVFPKFLGNVYLVLGDGLATLVDAGSGLGRSDDDLLAGVERVRDHYGEGITLADIRRVVLTHSHIDHFGGMQMVRRHTAAPITMHAIDRRVLTNYEGRRALATQSLGAFLLRAGVGAERQAELLRMYGWSKGVFQAMPVEHVVEDGDTIDGIMQVIHAPGHCPGQICLRIENVLLTADHILSRTSPHLAPETITPGTGLEHYLAALRVVERLEGVELALGGHEEPMADLRGRIRALYASHERKLTRMLDLIRQHPQNVAELTAQLYPQLQGYDVLLALEEVGAHVEYLYLRGQLRVNNIDEAADMLASPWCYELLE